MRDWNLAEQHQAFTRSVKWQAAVLPFGATEPHNLHIPYGTDTYQVDVIADQASEKAYQEGAKVVRLPTMPYGVNTNHLKIPGAIACSVKPTTTGNACFESSRSTRPTGAALNRQVERQTPPEHGAVSVPSKLWWITRLDRIQSSNQPAAKKEAQVEAACLCCGLTIPLRSPVGSVYDRCAFPPSP